MTSWVIADSSLLLATVLEEPYSAKAHTLVASWKSANIQIAAPTLLRYELVAVMRKSVHRQRLTAEEAVIGLKLLLGQPVRLMIDDGLLKRAYELATQFNRPTAYDSQYLAVAERLECDFWTVDERLYNAVNHELTWVKWLHNFTE